MRFSIFFLLINGFLPSHMDVLYCVVERPVNMSAPTPRLNQSDFQTQLVPYLSATHHIESIMEREWEILDYWSNPRDTHTYMHIQL